MRTAVIPGRKQYFIEGKGKNFPNRMSLLRILSFEWQEARGGRSTNLYSGKLFGLSECTEAAQFGIICKFFGKKCNKRRSYVHLVTEVID
jgi:hypothetical protein